LLNNAPCNAQQGNLNARMLSSHMDKSISKIKVLSTQLNVTNRMEMTGSFQFETTLLLVNWHVFCAH